MMAVLVLTGFGLVGCQTGERPSEEALRQFGELREQVSDVCAVGDFVYETVLLGASSSGQARGQLLAAMQVAEGASDAIYDAGIQRFVPISFSPAAVAGSLGRMHDGVVEGNLLLFTEAGQDMQRSCREARQSTLDEAWGS